MRKVFAMFLALFLLALTGSALAEGPQDTWKITGPADGAIVKAGEVTLTVDPGQMKIAKPGAVVAGEGHWHFLMDGKEAGKGATNTFTFKDLTPGKHLLRVELHQGDHILYPGDKGREVTINVALPNTGANVAIYAVPGLALLAAGGYFFFRKGGTKAA